jgi:hypothetical protein
VTFPLPRRPDLQFSRSAAKECSPQPALSLSKGRKLWVVRAGKSASPAGATEINSDSLGEKDLKITLTREAKSFQACPSSNRTHTTVLTACGPYSSPSVESGCGKVGSPPRIKPVIARDTTCSVSLLTGTICGSNFAIPSTNFRLTGMRRNYQAANATMRESPARGDSALSADSRLRRPGFQIRKPGARAKTPGTQRRKPEAECKNNKKCGGRSPVLPRGFDERSAPNDNLASQSSVTCPMDARQRPPGGSKKQEP